MKQLFIMRHAHACQRASSSQRDFDRPLTSEGLAEISHTGARFKAKAAWFPELIVCSPALRTVSTATALAESLNYTRDIMEIEAIYQASYLTLLSIMSEFDDAFKTIILVGHNPGVSDVANYLGLQLQASLTPASLCGFTWSSEHWSDVNSTLIQQNYVDIR